MSLQRQQTSHLHHGWVRAVVLLVLYISISVVAGSLGLSSELWFTLNFVFAVILVFIFRKFIDRKSFKSLGFEPAYLFPDSIIGVSQGIFLVSTGSLLIYYLKGLVWIDISPDAKNLAGSFILLLMIAFAEELVFRGYVLRSLLKSFNKWLALLISAALFTLAHLSNPGVPPVGLLNTFLGGLLLGITFINTRKLWLPIFFHFSWNFMQGPILGYPVSGISFNSLLVLEARGNKLISGGDYGFEGSVVCSVLLILSVVVWSYFERKRSHPGY